MRKLPYLMILLGAGACHSNPPPPSNETLAETVLEKAPAGAPLGAALDPASADSASTVAAALADAVAHGRLIDTGELWDPEGGAADLAARLRGYSGVALAIGEAGDPIEVEGRQMVEVPAVLSGSDRSGGPFRVEGPIVLRMGEAGEDANAPPRWQIVRAPLPPGRGTADGAKG